MTNISVTPEQLIDQAKVYLKITERTTVEQVNEIKFEYESNEESKSNSKNLNPNE